MEDVADIERREGVVTLYSEARNSRRPVPIHVGPAGSTNAAAVKQIVSVRKYFGPRIGSEEIQPVREVLFDLGLEAMVVAVSRGNSETSVGAEIGEGNPPCQRERVARSALAGKRAVTLLEFGNTSRWRPREVTYPAWNDIELVS